MVSHSEKYFVTHRSLAKQWKMEKRINGQSPGSTSVVNIWH